MSWYQHLRNPEAILSLYASPPDLEKVRLLEVIFYEDGPTVRLRLNMNSFPDNPPERWVRQGFNTAQVQMSFFGISALEMSGWSTNNIVTVRLDAIASDLFELECFDDTFRLKLHFDSAQIDRFNGYLMRDP
jgi:hypothetical protein